MSLLCYRSASTSLIEWGIGWILRIYVKRMGFVDPFSLFSVVYDQNRCKNSVFHDKCFKHMLTGEDFCFWNCPMGWIWPSPQYYHTTLQKNTFSHFLGYCWRIWNVFTNFSNSNIKKKSKTLWKCIILINQINFSIWNMISQIIFLFKILN